MHKSDEILLTTCRIGCTAVSQEQRVGTSVFLSRPPSVNGPKDMLVTTRHTVEKFDSLSTCLTVTTATGRRMVVCETIPLRDSIFFHPDDKVDLAAISIDGITAKLRSEGKEIVRTDLGPQVFRGPRFIEDSDAIEELYVVGYPSGGWDSDRNLPVVRRGTSSMPINHGTEFRISCETYSGDSGSAVFAVRKEFVSSGDGKFTEQKTYHFVGMVHRVFYRDTMGELVEIPYTGSAEMKKAAFQMPTGLSKCYNASAIVQLVRHVEELGNLGHVGSVRVA